MKAPERILGDHAFAQRAIELWSRLEGSHGEVTRAADDVRGGRRLLEFHVSLPGFIPVSEATLILIERYERVRGGWALAEYLYDYHREPRPSGRKAHHWHDGIFHAHCEEPRRPRAVTHFRDVPVDLLEAAGDFEAVHLRGEIDCSGLFPLA
ncbi:MAG: hypothetical protein ACRDGT_11200 [Candidatus Limnocylindria bacterium]